MKCSSTFSSLLSAGLLVLAGAVAAAQVPDGRVILATDLQYQGPESALAGWPVADAKWAVHPFVGYENSSLSMEGPLVAEGDEDAAPLTTRVTELPEATHYVYIRFSPHIKSAWNSTASRMRARSSRSRQKTGPAAVTAVGKLTWVRSPAPRSR